MSLFSALGSATAGLRSVQAQVALVSDNIARSNDPNRTRHSLANVLDASGQVISTQYSREVDTAMRAQVQDLTATAGYSSTQNSYMQKIGDLLQTSTGTPQINQFASDFQNAIQTLAASPDSEVAQNQAVQTANTFAREINRVSQGVEALNTQLRSDTKSSVDDINNILGQIDEINKNIVSLQGKGAVANDAQDKRDGLIKQLSGYMNIRTIERPDGRVAIFTPNGLALDDAEPAKLSLDGGNINLVSGNLSTTVNNQISGGKLGALLSMSADGSTSTPPKPASSDPTGEIVRKLRSQLDTYAQMLTGGSKPGEPTSFADAYDKASPVQAGEQPTQFFTGDDRFTIAVNTNLLNGNTKIKQSALKDMLTAMNATGRSFTADGLTLTDTSYSNALSNITGTWMATAKTVQDQSASDTDAKQSMETRYASATGVNIDEEIANLQQLQTSYAASARVMQVANTMFDALEAVIR